MSGRFWISLGAVLAAIGVTAGAIGSHVLKDVLKVSADELQTYEVAVRYQMYHALAIVIVGLISRDGAGRLLTAAGTAFVLGTVLFSGGIYAAQFSSVRSFFHVVPVGGMTWIVGWLLLAAAAQRWGRPGN